MKTEIFLIRHGESCGNKNRIFAGQTDVDLTERGYEQAQVTADYLASEKIDAIYSSDLVRAYNTAIPHAKMRGLDVIASKGLREINIGIMEGADIRLVTKRRGEAFSRYWTTDFGFFAFADGESTVECGERFYKALETIALENSGRRILVASHAAVIRAFWGKICRISPMELGRRIPFASNASVSRVDYEDGIFIPKSYSENEHLSSVGFIDNKAKLC
ncbi:MAG: histidine phosphatase family protein [Clostridia bacterium]|nr:histidine phosphatase family protein [Clostridia bacterium]